MIKKAIFLIFVFFITVQATQFLRMGLDWFYTKDWKPIQETNPYDCSLPVKEHILRECHYFSIG